MESLYLYTKHSSSSKEDLDHNLVPAIYNYFWLYLLRSSSSSSSVLTDATMMILLMHTIHILLYNNNIMVWPIFHLLLVFLAESESPFRYNIVCAAFSQHLSPMWSWGDVVVIVLVRDHDDKSKNRLPKLLQTSQLIPFLHFPPTK